MPVKKPRSSPETLREQRIGRLQDLAVLRSGVDVVGVTRRFGPAAARRAAASCFRDDLTIRRSRGDRGSRPRTSPSCTRRARRLRSTIPRWPRRPRRRRSAKYLLCTPANASLLRGTSGSRRRGWRCRARSCPRSSRSDFVAVQPAGDRLRLDVEVVAGLGRNAVRGRRTGTARDPRSPGCRCSSSSSKLRP